MKLMILVFASVLLLAGVLDAQVIKRPLERWLVI